MALRYESKVYVLEKQIIKINEASATPKEIASYKKHYQDTTKVTCIMVYTKIPKLKMFYEE